MRNYRYRRQTNRFGLFAGVTASVVRADVPPATAVQISQRVWIDASHVEDGFRHTPLSLTQTETDSLRLGLSKVARHIEDADQSPYITVTVHALEIVLVDYAEDALAPAIAGWAAEEFGFPHPQVHVHFDQPTRQFTFDWED